MTDIHATFKREERQLEEKIKDLKVKRILDIGKSLVVGTVFVLLSPFWFNRKDNLPVSQTYFDQLMPMLIITLILYPFGIYYGLMQAKQDIFETKNALRRLRKNYQKEIEANNA